MGSCGGGGGWGGVGEGGEDKKRKKKIYTLRVSESFRERFESSAGDVAVIFGSVCGRWFTRFV